jgi:hypothetical protein
MAFNVSAITDILKSLNINIDLSWLEELFSEDGIIGKITSAFNGGKKEEKKKEEEKTSTTQTSTTTQNNTGGAANPNVNAAEAQLIKAIDYLSLIFGDSAAHTQNLQAIKSNIQNNKMKIEDADQGKFTSKVGTLLTEVKPKTPTLITGESVTTLFNQVTTEEQQKNPTDATAYLAAVSAVSQAVFDKKGPILPGQKF